MAPHHGLAVVVEVAEPVRRLHEGRAGAHGGVGEPNTVIGGAEPDLLWRELGRCWFGLHQDSVVALGDLGNELVAAPVDRAHDALRLAGVTNGLTERLDAAREG